MSRGRNAGNRGQGSKWCSKVKRARIYARDGNRCVWCGVECLPPSAGIPERVATVDHLIPRCEGGTNVPQNLVTACWFHNMDRRNRPAFEYAERVAANLDHLRRILERIVIATTTPFPKAQRKWTCKAIR